MSAYEDYLNGLQQQDGKKLSLINSLSQAANTNPDEFAGQVKLSKAASISLDALPQYKEEAQQAKLLGEVGLDRLWRDAPKTSAFLSSPDKAKLAHDDVGNLSGMEAAFSYLGGSAKAGLNDLAGAGAKLIDAVNPFTLSDNDAAVLFKDSPAQLEAMRNQSAAMGLSRFARGRTEASKQNMLDISPAAKANYGDLKYATTNPSEAAYLSPVKVVGDAIRSLPTTAALALTTYLTRGASIQAEKQALAAGATAEAAKAAAVSAATNMAVRFGAASEGSIGYAQQALQTQNEIESMPIDKIGKSPAYQQLIIQGYEPNAARIFLAARAGEQAGVGAGFVDGLTNAIGGKFLGKIIGEGGALLPRIGKGFANEAGVEFVQSGGEQVFQNIAIKANANPEQALSDGVLESMVQGLVVGGVTGGTFAGAMGRAQKKDQQAQQAEQATQVIEQINSLAAASKLRERDPETFAQFVEQATESGPVQHVFIDAQTLAQSGIAEQVAQLSPAVAEQYQAALDTGGQVRIPVAEYAATIAGTEFAQPLLDHLKTEPDGFSRAEAQEYMQSQAQEMQAEVERVMTAKQGDDTFKASRDAVKAEVKAQLDTANRFKPDVNDAYAAMVSNFYAVTGAKMGITPQELFAKYPMRVTAESVAGPNTLNQSDLSSVKAQWDAAGIKHSITESEDRISLSKIIVPQGLRGTGKGTVAMQALIKYADAVGKHVVLSPSGDFGSSKKRLAAFYKRFGFIENKGKNRAFTTSESMYRTAPGKVLHQAAKLEIQKAIELAKTPGNENLTVSIGEVQGWVVEAAKSAGIEIGGYAHTVDMFSIRHAIKKHGDEKKEASRGQIAINDNDIEAIPAAIMQPDSIILGLKNSRGQDQIFSVKTLDDGTMLVVEEVRKGRKTVALESIRKVPGAKNARELLPSVLLNAQNDAGANPIVVDAPAEGNDALNQGERGSFSPATLSITLLKNADLSTFLHESGHFFLEVTADIAGRADAPIEVQKDMDALLKWFGVRDIAEWHSLEFEEKRSYHEQFARGFEAYLFEGKAPSIEMTGIFQRFRAWMLNVYKELKNLNVELSDEVRAVFDRMLATSEEIALAEQGRSMLPLFETAEQAGMTTEEFNAYQSLGIDATQDAISELETRGLRDMQWLANAKGREVKKLKKLSREKRAEVEMEVRREVMSQPVYRAWQFLTAKISAEDKITPAPGPRKSDPDMVDPSIDSLFVAIAKLGGLKRDQVESQWGFDKSEKSPQPVFGKHLLRRNNGRSLDSMAAELADLGYIDKDENGRYDINQLEESFDAELRGAEQYSFQYDYAGRQGPDARDNAINPDGLSAGRLDRGALQSEFGSDDSQVWMHLDELKMTAKDGLHHDVVAELFGFSSGDELVQALAASESPKVKIDAMTDQRMLEQFGDLSSEQAINVAADQALHNDARARFVATEHSALAKASGAKKILVSAAKEFAANMIARLKLRDIKPSQYASAEARAAKAAAKASRAGDIETAATEKRNELINLYATKAAHNGRNEAASILSYFARFDKISKTLDIEYREQIEALLDRFDLRASTTLKAIDKRKSLASWVESQREMGLEPDIPDHLIDESSRKSAKDMTLEELRGLRDTIVQIEHLGRLKNRLLTAQGERQYEAVRNEIVAGIEEHAGDRVANTRTATTNMGRAVTGLKRFWAAHIKVASWSRIMDGGKDGGPMWEYFIRSANAAGDAESVARASATEQLSDIMAPVFKLGKMGGKGQYFPSIKRSLNRESRIAIALNTGNAGNMQRLLGGEGWTMDQLQPVLQTITRAEWRAVQAIWDHFESYRPQIAAKERRIYGKEPNWIEPRPFTVTVGQEQLELRGGYYPIKYDPAASERAEAHDDAEAAKRQLQGAYTSATTRRSFTKGRVEEVKLRPLLYTMAGMYSGVNDVIHDLSWHEWLIDANKLLRSKGIDGAIRNHYGPEVKAQFKSWVQDVAEGGKGVAHAGEAFAEFIRKNTSVAGLGFNLMSALMQPLGLSQSIVRVGLPWIGRGVAKYMAHPIDVAREANEKSDFMAMRSRTQFRELNELRNRVQGQSTVSSFIQDNAYVMMTRCQQLVDIPTWHGAYEKAIANGQDEDRSVALADQAVIDAQGGGMTKDLSAIERGGPLLKLFTVFYSFMNTALNLGVTQTMTAESKGKLMSDYLLLFIAPVVLGALLKGAITPGDDEDKDLGKLASKLIGEEISFLMGLMLGVREFSEAGKTVAGVSESQRGYSGPAGVRLIADTGTMAKQLHQGELDDAFRKAMVNVMGDLMGLPSAQINRSITGAQALADGKTQNPLAIGFGYQEPR